MTAMQREAPSYELIYTESLRIESKLFFLDARKNGRGIYLKISERKDATDSRATVVFPRDTIPRLQQYLDFCLLQASQGTVPPVDTTSGTKAFRLELGRNRRGSFLKVTESGSGPKGWAVLFIPAGGPGNGGWQAIAYAIRNAQEAIAQHAVLVEGAPLLGYLPSGQLAIAAPPLPPFADTQQVQQLQQQQQQQPPQQPQRATQSQQQTLPAEQLTLPLTVQNGPQLLSFEVGSSQQGPTLIVAETIGQQRSILHLPANALTTLQLAIDLVQNRLRAGAA